LTGSPSIETQHGHPGIVLATLSLANVMALLDLFVVNVALHDIGVGLHYQSSLSDVAWVLNAYALFFGALLIPAGRFADKYGRKATFILGLAVFTVASLACAVRAESDRCHCATLRLAVGLGVLGLARCAALYRRPAGWFLDGSPEAGGPLEALARLAAALPPADQETVTRFAEFLAARQAARP